MLRLSRIFVLYIFAYLVVIWLVFSSSEKDIVNLDSMYKMTFLLLALAVFLLKADHRSVVLILVLSVYILMFYTAQFFLYIVAPEKAKLSYIPFLYPEAVSHAITYVLLGTLAAGLGFITGGRIASSKKRKIKKPKLLPFSPKKTLFLLFVSAGITSVCVFIYRFMNVNLIRPKSIGGSIFGFLTFFLNDAIMILIVFLVYMQKWKFIRPNLKKLMIAGISAVVLLNFTGGSRGALVRPMLYLFFALFAIMGDIKVSKKLLLTIVLAIGISFAAFPFITFIKNAWFSGVNVTDLSSFKEEFSTDYIRLEYDTLNFIYRVANRLDGVGSLTAVLTIPPAYFREFLTFEDQVKLLINKLLPFANPFPGVIPSSRLYRVIIFDFSFDEILSTYNTNAYTLWGLSYAYFGWWGGLLAVYVMAFLLSVLYQRAAGSPSIYNIFLRGWVILIIYGWLRAFGFDVLIRSQYMVLATGIGFIVIMKLIDRGKNVDSSQKGVLISQDLGKSHGL